MSNAPSSYIPSLLLDRPRDHRGYPIPFTSLIDSTGIPRFTLTDPEKFICCLDNNLCSICGHPLYRGKWFIGGPEYMLNPKGAIKDPPTHYECIIFALQSCPFLINPKYQDHLHLPPSVARLTHDQQLQRSEYHIIGMSTKRFGAVIQDHRIWLIPERPFQRIEYWQNGIKLVNAPSSDNIKSKQRETITR